MGDERFYRDRLHALDGTAWPILQTAALVEAIDAQTQAVRDGVEYLNNTFERMLIAMQDANDLALRSK